MRNLEAHLSSIKQGQRGLVVGNKAAVQKYSAELEKHQESIIVHDIDSENLIYRDDIDLVIVLGINNRDAQMIYAQCFEYKLKKVPVVFGNNERGLTFEAANWRSVDLTILGMFHLATQYIAGLERKGAYTEFGVFDGRSFTMACHSLRNVCNEFCAFDSFQGIVGALQNEKQLYVDGAYFANLETFWHNMEVSGCSDLPIRAVKGSFQETLQGRSAPEDNINHISLVHIDSDVYEAAKLALDYVTPSLINGALIMFDEFHAFGANDNKGERRALKEWLEENPSIYVEVYRNYTSVSRSYIVHKKA